MKKLIKGFATLAQIISGNLFYSENAGLNRPEEDKTIKCRKSIVGMEKTGVIYYEHKTIK
jgi:hypothetical protein